MENKFRTPLVLLAAFTLLTGLVYPLFVLAVAQSFFPSQANGSLIPGVDGAPVGSALLGQSFDSPQYFWGRLSATSGAPYNAAASGGSNYSMMNERLHKAAAARIAALRATDPNNIDPIPVDLVTASASGLDPHISPAAAFYQAPRIARTRGLSLETVRDLVLAYTEKPILGVFGEARVNVLRLNLALDSLQ